MGLGRRVMCLSVHGLSHMSSSVGRNQTCQLKGLHSLFSQSELYSISTHLATLIYVTLKIEQFNNVMSLMCVRAFEATQDHDSHLQPRTSVHVITNKEQTLFMLVFLSSLAFIGGQVSVHPLDSHNKSLNSWQQQM